MDKNLYIITGSSSGIGKKISLLLLKNNQKVIGISRNKLKVKSKNFQFIKHDFKTYLNIKKIFKLLKNYKYIYIICAAGKRSNLKNDIENIVDKININFFNQFQFINEIKNLNIKIKKVVFFSSFNIFREKNIEDIGYQIGKRTIFEITKNDASKNFQCYVMGNVLTKMLKQNPSLLKSLPLIGNYLEKKISLQPEYIAKQVISNLSNNSANIFYYPKIHPYLIKCIISFLEKIKN